MTIPDRIMDEAHTALCELCTAYICPPEEDCHCALTLRKALLAAEQRGREMEREACAKLAETVEDGESAYDRLIDVDYWAGRDDAGDVIAAAIRSRTEG